MKNGVKELFEKLKNDKTFVNVDSQGWPERKIDVRTLLESLGFGTYEINGESYLAIKSDAKVLDAYPTILEDDGMGYGTNEQFVIDVTSNHNEEAEAYCHFFVEKELENKDMWLDNHILPGTKIKFNGHNVALRLARCVEGNMWFEGRIYDEGQIPSSINVPESYVKEYVKENLYKDE